MMLILLHFIGRIYRNKHSIIYVFKLVFNKKFDVSQKKKKKNQCFCIPPTIAWRIHYDSLFAYKTSEYTFWTLLIIYILDKHTIQCRFNIMLIKTGNCQVQVFA